MIDPKTALENCTYVAFDTETSGAYPVGYDIVEFGAVKYYQGREIDRLQCLLKPREKMSDFIIGIHGISNEMVVDAPSISEKVSEIHNFFKGAVALAHHAPFDMGFLSFEFERGQLPFLNEPVLCTSLLSRKLIHESENHKLQTLVKTLKLEGGSAHRAFDDAYSCYQVFMECSRRLGQGATLAQALEAQGKSLQWHHYAILHSGDTRLITLSEAILGKKVVDMEYEKGGGGRTEVRQVLPIGIVRNPDSDFLHATCLRDHTDKRFYLNKIKDIAIRF